MAVVLTIEIHAKSLHRWGLSGVEEICKCTTPGDLSDLLVFASPGGLCLVKKTAETQATSLLIAVVTEGPSQR